MTLPRVQSLKDPRGPLWWALLVVPLWGLLSLCVHWEPVMRDGWGHLAWLREHPLSVGVLVEHAKGYYLHQNPRLGQVVTLASYAPGPYHTLLTPLLELGVFALLTTLALGRAPSVRRADDAFTALVVTALVFACAPQIGPLLFYRPFTYNYTFGLALNLLWLVPYRLALASPRPARWWRAPVSFALGVAAGLCNEHTGLAFLALGVAAWWLARRRADRGRAWMIAGVLGLAAGYTLLLTAPGQRERYEGLAAQAGIVQRIVERGVVDNLVVVGFLALALAPAALALALVLVERRRLGPAAQPRLERRAPVGLALAGLVCTLTLLASPKIGPRLYLPSVALISAALTGWLVAELRSPWARRLCAVLAAATLAYAAIRMVAIHRVVGPLGATRLDRLARGAATAITVPPYPYAPSRYFLGEDLRSPSLREIVAELFHVARVDLEPGSSPDLDALGQPPVE